VQTESSSLHNIKEGYSIFCDKQQSNDSRKGSACASNLSDKNTEGSVPCIIQLVTDKD